jgi:hypothetical protein
MVKTQWSSLLSDLKISSCVIHILCPFFVGKWREGFYTADMNTDESPHPPRYAFIDVQNTISTITQLLGFTIDWQKLYRYLKDHWKCEKVFFYSGIR